MGERLRDWAFAVIAVWFIISVPWLIGVWMGIGDQGGVTWRAVAAGAAPFLIGALIWRVVRRWRD